MEPTLTVIALLIVIAALVMIVLFGRPSAPARDIDMIEVSLDEMRLEMAALVNVAVKLEQNIFAGLPEAAQRKITALREKQSSRDGRLPNEVQYANGVHLTSNILGDEDGEA